jgi:hypothetical protein
MPDLVDARLLFSSYPESHHAIEYEKAGHAENIFFGNPAVFY